MARLRLSKKRRFVRQNYSTFVPIFNKFSLKIRARVISQGLFFNVDPR